MYTNKIFLCESQEPHGNGPLFVEMHFYMRNGKLADSKFGTKIKSKFNTLHYRSFNIRNLITLLTFLPHLVDAFRKKRNLKALGMPHFIGHGSHDLNGKKHRFVVMPRFGADVWSIFLANGRKMPLHTVYRLAIQMVRH